MYARGGIIRNTLSYTGAQEVIPAETPFYYWDDVPSRRLRPELLTGEQALEQARAFARAEQDKET